MLDQGGCQPPFFIPGIEWAGAGNKRRDDELPRMVETGTQHRKSCAEPVASTGIQTQMRREIR